MPPTRRRALRLAAGVALAAASVYVVVSHVDLPQVMASLRQASTVWIIAGLASVLATLVLVTARWITLLWPVDRVELWRLWNSVVTGQAANIVFPLRAGEGARVAITCGATTRAPGGVVVALAFERALDVSAMAAVVILLVAAGFMPSAFADAVPVVLASAIGTMAVALLLARSLPEMCGAIRRRLRPTSALAAWLGTQQASMLAARADLSRGPRSLLLGAMTALILLSSASTNYLIFRAFGLPLPAVAAFVVLVVLQVGTTVVSVPGNVGVFHYLAVLTLSAWQVPAPIALATAVVLHAVTNGPRILLGAVGAVSEAARSRPPNISV